MSEQLEAQCCIGGNGGEMRGLGISISISISQGVNQFFKRVGNKENMLVVNCSSNSVIRGE